MTVNGIWSVFLFKTMFNHMINVSDTKKISIFLFSIDILNISFHKTHHLFHRVVVLKSDISDTLVSSQP